MKNLTTVFNFKNISRAILLFFLFLLFFFISAYSYATSVSADISNSVFRLHVIANSDSEEDQNLKYKVRDSLLEYMNSICSETPSKEEALQIVSNNIDNFYSIAQQTIKDNGFEYPVNITVGKYDFPTKQYGDISLPAGTYDALRVEIGTASGRNWWCVMFPPLCFVDVSSGVVPDSSKELLEENMSKEEYDLITTSYNNNISFKFKIVELMDNLKTKLSLK